MQGERRQSVLTGLLYWQVLWLLLVGCTTAPLPLNSERIAARYGSYSVSVLHQDAWTRVSSLASRHGRRLVTRTLAVTLLDEPNEIYAAASSRIRAGASIGSTFRDAGWQVTKQTRYIGSYRLQDRESPVASLMNIAAPVPLAMHAYRFLVSRDGQTLPFATIIELHHPDYLRQADLRRIYGSSRRSTAAEESRLLASVAAALDSVPLTAVP